MLQYATIVKVSTGSVDDVSGSILPAVAQLQSGIQTGVEGICLVEIDHCLLHSLCKL